MHSAHIYHDVEQVCYQLLLSQAPLVSSLDWPIELCFMQKLELVKQKILEAILSLLLCDVKVSCYWDLIIYGSHSPMQVNCV